MIGGNPLNSHSFSRNKSLAAVLVAIAIPVFTSQLEKSREATDVANVRSAYAAMMSEFITEGSASAVTVTAQQQQESWQGPGGTLTIQVEGSESTYDIPAKTNTYTISIDSATALPSIS